MSQLLIEIDTPEDEVLLLSLLPKLGGRVIDKQPDMAKKTFTEVAREIAARGGVGESFGYPSDWQREVRSWDRVLDGREE